MHMCWLGLTRCISPVLLGFASSLQQGYLLEGVFKDHFADFQPYLHLSELGMYCEKQLFLMFCVSEMQLQNLLFFQEPVTSLVLEELQHVFCRTITTATNGFITSVWVERRSWTMII